MLAPEIQAHLRAQFEHDNADAAASWLHRQHHVEWERANEYVIEQFRAWSIEREKMFGTRVKQLPAHLEKRLQQRTVSPEEWGETLQCGLWLERRKIFLPWRAQLHELEQLGPHKTLANGSILCWDDETIFDGLKMQVSTNSLLTTRGLYHLNCKPPDYAVWEDAVEGTRAERAHLTRMLGEPRAPWQDFWQWNSVGVRITTYSPNEFHFSEPLHKYVEIRFDEK